MKRRVGDMLTYFVECDWCFITTNGSLKSNGALVMGAGIARQVRDRWPGIDKVCGAAVKASAQPYGLLLGKKMGLFQVKYHWKQPAQLELIEYATIKLRMLAESQPGKVIFLNFPGIGYGGLSQSDVLPIIAQLPDNVIVWTL